MRAPEARARTASLRAPAARRERGSPRAGEDDVSTRRCTGLHGGDTGVASPRRRLRCASRADARHLLHRRRRRAVDAHRDALGSVAARRYRISGHEGAFQSQPGDARQARDANRIAAAVRDAALKRIDFLLITHFHADHDGGAPELAALVPIRTFIDHGTVPAEAEQTSRGTLDAFQRYAAVRARARHIEPKPGDRLPLTGLVATVVSSARATLTSALDGAGRANASCGAPRPPQEPHA